MTIVIAIALLVFGFVAGFSIGAPFFIAGVALLILSPVRAHGRIFWPLLLGLIGLLAGGFAVYPYSCSTKGSIVTPTGSSGPSETVCSSVIGLSWSGERLAQPPPEAGQLALLVGLMTGVTTAGLTWMVVTRRERRSLG